MILSYLLGNARADLGKLLDNMNHQAFTLIGIDPPGYGYSRPPERKYDLNTYYQQDASFIVEAMKVKIINFDSF